MVASQQAPVGSSSMGGYQPPGQGGGYSPEGPAGGTSAMADPFASYNPPR